MCYHFLSKQGIYCIHKKMIIYKVLSTPTHLSRFPYVYEGAFVQLEGLSQQFMDQLVAWWSI